MDDRKSNLIDKYLQEGLSEEEKPLFQTLQQQPQFAQEVNFRGKLRKATQEDGRETLNSFFDQLDQELDDDDSHFISRIPTGVPGLRKISR